MSFSIEEITTELVARLVSGPMRFRLIIQPAMATFLGIRDGLKDAAVGRPPFLSGMLFRPDSRKSILKETLPRLARPVLFATLIDAIVQYLMFRHVRPVVAMTVGTLLMGLPYTIARGLSNRIVSTRRGAARRLPVA